MRSRHIPFLSVLSFCAFAAAACGGGPSESQVRAAVEAALARRPVCSKTGPPCLSGASWTFPIVLSQEGEMVTRDRAAVDPRHLNELVAAGLLVRSDTTAVVPRYRFAPGATGGPYDAAVPGVVYRLTETGRQAYMTYVAPGFGTVGAFRYGRWEVVEVTSVSEPAEALGQTYVTVRFLRRLTDVPSWAERPSLRAMRPELDKVLEGRSTPVADQVTLVRRGKEWSEAGRS